jgi:hypothetical protein
MQYITKFMEQSHIKQPRASFMQSNQTSTLYLIQMRQLLNKVKELFTIKFIKFCILLSHLKLRRDISHAVNIAIVSIATRC